jgi:hypothetical protein
MPPKDVTVYRTMRAQTITSLGHGCRKLMRFSNARLPAQRKDRDVIGLRRDPGEGVESGVRSDRTRLPIQR